ncbi:MAG TPA: choice-of-anchor L domain-containing protein [Pirellulales bacterium]|nr:choice-of-anchor L domain-containing protein [Pirellulales bacterium]
MGMWRSLHPFHSSTPKPSRRSSVKRSSRRRALKRRETNASRAGRRELQLERFEERLLLTAAPQLLSILTNSNDVVFAPNAATQPLTTAPQELDLLFNEGQVIDPATLGGIQIVRAGVDHTLNTADDAPIQPGYVGIGSIPNEVVVRFASTLPDDLYQITLLGTGPDALTNSSNPPVPFSSGNSTQPNQRIDFQIDTAPQVLSVVPEPITRNSDGSLSQATDTIDVYFNKPIQPLPTTINQLDPHLFQLVATQNTADPTDDQVYTPNNVSFDLSTNMAQLTFAAPISSLSTGSFRLRIGDNQPVATGSNAAPVTVPITVGSAGSTFGDANTLTQDPGPYNVGDLNAVSHQLLTGGVIGPVSDLPATATPGGNLGPGLSGIPIDNHVDPNAAQPSGQTHYVPTITYNFPDIYGSVPGNPQLHNVITPAQQQLTREIFQLYSYYYGVQFQEVGSATLGAAELGVVTGVVQSLDQSAPVGLTGIAQAPATPFPVTPLASRGEALAVMNAGIFNTESQYGGPWFMEALRQIGIMLGLTNVNGAPPGTVMGAGGNDPATNAPAEPVFPGNADILHGRYLYQPDSNAINMYKFTVTTPGAFSAETIAQRLTDASGAPDTSLLNTVLTLYNETHVIQLPTTGANPVGSAIVPGSSFTLNDGTSPAVTFAFDNGITPIPAGAVSIPFTASQTAHDVALSLAQAINGYLTTHSLNVSANVEFDRVVLSGPLTVTHSASQGSVAYSVDREIVSRNDDYFGTDSYLKLQLAPGNYYVAVTSTGNANFNPNVPDSGAGGTTTGAYNLRLDFTPTPVSTLTDDGLSLIVPNVPLGGQGGIQNLDKFTISTDSNTSVTFQFVTQGSTPQTGVTAILVSPGATQDQVAQAVATAIANSGLTTLTLRYDGHGQVNLGGSATTTITTSTSALAVWGTATRHVLEGNSDGASGAYNFWFASNDASTIYVDKLSAATADPTLGTIGNPYNTIAGALQAASDRIIAPTGAALATATPQTFVVNDGTYAVTFEFSVNGGAVSAGNIAVSVQSTDTAAQVAQEIYNAILGAEQGGYLTLGPSFAPPATDSDFVDVTGAAFVDVKNAPALLAGTKIVRVVGNIGADNSLGVPINPQPSVSTLAPSGSAGQTFSIAAGTLSLVFEFTQDPTATPGNLLADGNYAVALAPGASAQDIANAMAAAINASPLAQADGGAVAASVTGDAVAFRVNLTGVGQIAINAQNTPSLIAASNAQPYEIGYDQFTHQPLADGGDLNVPQGVTLMIDAGAVFKMEGANLNVGLNSPNIDRSGSALQVLGAPSSSVYFTSFHDNQLGGITDNVTAPSPGDYGGIVFHQHSDLESQGIFLNTVNHANIRYAGGTVIVDGVPAVYNPIYLDGSRPTIDYNTITLSHDAAMSADPNSFQETIFGSSAYDPASINPSIGPYVADYNRTGPDIHGNLLSAVVPGGMAIVTPDASQIIAGETFLVETIDGSGNTSYATFEFTTSSASIVNGKLADGNWAVLFKPGNPAQNIAGDTALQVATDIADAVNAAGIAGVSATVRTVTSSDGTTAQEAVLAGVSKIELPSSRTFNAPTGQSIVDGQTFTIVNPVSGSDTVFEFDNTGAVAAGHVAVPFLASDSATALAGKIAAAINGSSTGVGAIALGNVVMLTSVPNIAVSTTGSVIAGLQSLTVPNGNLLTAGSTFSITNKSNGAITVFEFTTNAASVVNGKLADGNYAIVYASSDQAATIAAAAAAKVNDLGLGFAAIASGANIVLTGLSDFRFASPLSLDSSIVANTVNGLFVRTQNVQGQTPETLDVAARFTATDIVYVISDNLVIQGNPGGPVGSTPRIAGRLAIDPGAIVKLLGARIEVQMGANLIAEGDANQQVVFTSLHDDSFGAGGTFDTDGDNYKLSAPPAVAQPGDWSGIYFAPTSRGSLDYARLAYGGGSSSIAGGTDNFDAIEIRQAQVRIADSTIANNAAGLATTPTRDGLLANDSAAIYVLGAQPTIVNNVLLDNYGAAISINANSLTSDVIPDPGRSTGAIQQYAQFDDNRGPLVRLNRIGNIENRPAINGMLVRGATLDTSSVWDDTDIVHVVENQISVPNVDSRGGLLLESSASQSLVVKLQGDNAGFTATGTPSDIQNRIGGSVQVVGTPGHNVILTSLLDTTAGAGLTPGGQPQNDTNNTGVGTPADTPPTFPPSGGQLTVTPSNNAAALVNSMLLRPLPSGVTVAGTNYVGGATEAGTYINGDGVPLQIPQKGAILTTGIAQIPAQNTSTDFGADLGLPGDPRLSALIGGTPTYDACELTFTVNVDPSSSIKSGIFEFQFGSDEYPEFVGSFNDVLAGFIDGSPTSNFLHDSKGNLVSVNSAFFDINNNVQLPAKSPLNIEYDGMTSGLRASFPLHSGLNTITIAIADALDGILDSGVLMTDLHFSTQSVGAGGVTRAGASSGQWNSITLDQNSNDTNVAVVNEAEPANTGGVDTNGTVATAQNLGVMAPNMKSGDDTERLGFVVNGAISPNAPGDMDMYRFQAQPGTQVWLDIGNTSPGLDTVLELVDANGTVLARSDNSGQEAANPALLQAELPGNLAQTMPADTLLHGLYDPNSAADPALRDLNSTNPYDAGFRLVLPGTLNPSQPLNNYYVRVRSRGADSHYNDLGKGLSSGVYQLQVRLQEQEAFPGSTVQNADIRYATNGIQVIGLPAHSPLIAEAGSSQAAHNTMATAQDLGNLLTTDRNAIGVSGNLSSGTTQDWYKFELNYNLAQVIAGLNSGDKTFATMFDIDYADGLARPNTTLSVFDAAGNLIYVGRDSNIGNDQPLPGQSSTSALTDLTRGSAGQLDPFVGTVQLPAGPTRTYYVAISSDATLPTALNATFVKGAAQPLIRLEPIDSLNRIVEDHIGSQGGQTAQDPKSLTAAFNGNTSSQAGIDQLNSSATPFSLSDVTLFVDQAGNNGHLETVNPFTGQSETDINPVPSSGSGYGDIAMRNDGQLYGFSLGTISAGGGNYNLIDTGTAAINTQGNGGIVTYAFNNANPPVLTANNTGVQINAIAFDQSGGPNNRLLFGVGSYAGGNGVSGFANGLYEFNPNTGAVLGATGNATNPTDPPPKILNLLGGPGGQITGMAYVNGTLYAVTSLGGLFVINNPQGNASATYVGTATALAGVNFTGLTAGPPDVAGGKYASDLFATDASGKLWSFDTAGILQKVFANGAASISLGATNLVGLAFSTLDYNLWHVTNHRGTDAGHGINVAPDQSRDPASANQPQAGNTSFYFGLEAPPSADPNSLNANSQPDAGNYATNPSVYHTYNLPGGAQGSLVSNSFSLSNYTAGDKPTLYFNYFLDTQQASATPADPTGMRDSARVFASVDGGKTWQMLATNDPEVPTSNTDPNGELPSYQSASSNTGSGDPRQQVQQLFDGSGSWRQARVDLGAYAGYSHIQLRFDFSTAGSMGQGLPGDNFGDPTSPQRGQNNAHEGWYVDDITVGFAERGEMVTGATANSTFFTVPQNQNVGAPQQILSGPYQLEIRQGTSYAQTVNPLTPDITLTQSFDTNDRLASGFTIIAPAGSAVTDGETFTVGDGVHTVTFEFDNDNSLQHAGDVAVPFQSSYTQAQMGAAIAAAINANLTLKGVTAGTVDNSVLNLTAPTGASLTDGQTFTVADQSGHSVVFEYDSNGSVQAGHVAVPFALTSTSADVAASISAAISNASSLVGLNVNVIATGSTSLVVVGGVASSTVTGDRVEVYGAAAVSAINAVQGNISVSFNNPSTSTTNVNHGSVSENGGTTSIWVASSAPAGNQTTVTLSAIDLAKAAGINPPLSSNVSFQYNSQSGPSIALTLTGGQPQLVVVTGLPQMGANNQPLADGPQAVELVATAAGYSSNSATIDVTDDPTLLPALGVTIDSPKSIAENSATPIEATITLNTPPLDHDLTVNVQSLNPGAAATPAVVTIPAGQTSATFPITAVDNNVINPGGKQTAVILATAAGYLGGSDTLTVLDDGDGQIPFNSAPTYLPQGPSHIINGQAENVPDPANSGASNPVEGSIETVLANPSNPNVVYVGTVNGGIWKTTDAMAAGGPTWTPLTDNMPSMSIGALQFDPTDATHQTLIAAIGRFSSFAFAGGTLDGLLRSTDGGQTWTQIDPGGFFNGKNLTGVAERGQTIVATDNGFLGGNGGLYVSSDGGATFTTVSGTPNSGLPDGRVTDLVADPNDNNRLYAGVLGSSGGIFTSTDRGQTWNNITPSGLTLNSFPFNDNIRIAVSATAGSPVYFGYVNNGHLANLYRSGDFGTTWQALDLPTTNENGTTEGLQPGAGDENPGGQGVIHFSIAADPTNPDLVYVGGDRQPGPGDGSATFPNSLGALNYSGRLFRGDASKPSGSQWTSLTHVGTASDSAPHADSRHLTFDGNVLLETDDGGIYMRTSPQSSSGDWFSLIGNLQVSELHNIAYDTNTKTIIAGAQDVGTPEQLPGSTTWNDFAQGDGGDVAVDDSNAGYSIRYASYPGLGGFSATTYDANGNQIGQTSYPSLIVNGAGGQDIFQYDVGLPFVTTFKLNAIDPTRMVFGGGSAVYESLDDGNTVTSLGVGGIPGGISGAAMAYGGRIVDQFGNVANNPNVLWVGAGNQVFLRTTAGGPLVQSNYTGGTVTSLAINPNNWQQAFVTDANGHVWMTTDQGASFIDISGPAGGATSFTTLTSDPHSVAFVPGLTSGTLFVGGIDGVYSTPIGSSGASGAWARYGQGLPHVPVYGLEYVPSQQLLVVGTMGRGAFLTNALGASGNLSVTVNGAKQVSDDSNVLTQELTITRNGSSGDLTFSLTSSDPTLASVPATLTIPDGKSLVSVDVTISDSAVAQYPATVVFTASVGGLNSISDSLDVVPNGDDSSGSSTPTDADTPSLTVSIPPGSQVQADTGVNSVVATVTRNSPTTYPLTVYLLSSDPSEASVPATVVIPAGQTSVSFVVGAVDQFAGDLSRLITITAASSGFVSGLDSLTVNPAKHILSYDRLGDPNLLRQQGQVVLQDNKISSSLDYGIVVEAAPRDSVTGQSVPGAVQNLSTLNTARLTPGATIENNLIVGGGQGGIDFLGDPNSTSAALAAVPFGRIVNNTIYGAATPTGIGVNVAQNASPTILNNIFANLATGVSVDNTSGTTVAQRSVYQNDGTNLSGSVFGGSDVNSLALSSTAKLFANAAAGNFYLLPGSPAIDSALNSIAERSAMHAAKTLTGIPDSPIEAPAYDLYGQLRTANPQTTPNGVGSTQFKDRGAIEAVDFTGPTTTLANPIDNGSNDQDPALNVVHDVGVSLTDFEIQFSDANGVGVDDSTIDSSKFVLYRNGTLLQPGIDYFFRYDVNTKTAFFTPATGTWLNGSVYTIAVNNGVHFDPFNTSTPANSSNGVKDLAGNLLQANSSTGFTRYDILLQSASGDAPSIGVPGVQNVPENGPTAANSLVFSSAKGNAVTVFNIDAPSNPVAVTLSTNQGTLTLAGVSGLSGVSGNNSASISFTGSLTAIDAALNGLTFVPTTYFNGSAAISITATDTVRNLTGSNTVNIAVIQVNQPPYLTLPPSPSISENTGVIFSTANGNSITMGDVDANGGVEQATLTVLNGAVTLAEKTGLTLLTGTGFEDTTVTIQGTLAAINAAFNGLIFTPALNFAGTASIQFSLDDLGNSGNGPLGQAGVYPQTSSFTLEINVTPINQPPYVKQPNPLNNLTVSENAPPSVIDLTQVIGDPDTSISPPENYPTISVTSNSNPGLVSVSIDPTTHLMTLTYGLDRFGQTSITLTAVDAGGNHPSLTYTFKVTVNKVELPPQTNNDGYVYAIGTPLVVTAPGVLGNDVELNHEPLKAVLFNVPAHGKLTLNADGSFTYIPDAGFDGRDSFVYYADNGSFRTAATVTLDSPTSQWVARMYTEVLGRPSTPSDDEINNWVSQIDHGESRSQVAQFFVTSAERRSRIIDQLYQAYLGRAADPAGLNYWLSVWAANSGPEQVQAGIIGSLEYFNTAARELPNLSPAAAWVTKLYENLLHRDPGQDEVDYWTTVIQSTSREDVVLGFVTSDEYRLGLMRGIPDFPGQPSLPGWYEQYLHRPIDNPGAQFWLAQMKAGYPQEAILEGIVSSDEYFNRA